MYYIKELYKHGGVSTMNIDISNNKYIIRFEDSQQRKSLTRLILFNIALKALNSKHQIQKAKALQLFQVDFKLIEDIKILECVKNV
jgi:hypothetical protein